MSRSIVLKLPQTWSLPTNTSSTLYASLHTFEMQTSWLRVYGIIDSIAFVWRYSTQHTCKLAGGILRFSSSSHDFDIADAHTAAHRPNKRKTINCCAFIGFKPVWIRYQCCTHRSKRFSKTNSQQICILFLWSFRIFNRWVFLPKKNSIFLKSEKWKSNVNSSRKSVETLNLFRVSHRKVQFSIFSSTKRRQNDASFIWCSVHREKKTPNRLSPVRNCKLRTKLLWFSHSLEVCRSEKWR